MPLDDKDIEQVTGIITKLLESQQESVAKMVSGAVAKATKTLEGKIPQVPDKEGLAALVKEQLDAARAAGGGEESDPNKPKTDPAKPDPTVLKLQEEIAAIKKDRERIALEAKDKEAKHARDEEEAALAQALGPHVKQSPAVVEAVKMLLLKRGVVTRNDKGEIVYKAVRKSGGNEYEDLLPLGDGVKEWAGTDEAKDFLPPKDTGGSGDSSKTKRAPGAGDPAAKRAGFFAALNGSSE